MVERQFDVVVFGATGFTGALTAEYLARNAPADTRWALAGRNREKLEDVRRRLGDGAGELELLQADVNDAGSLRAMAEATRVIISTVGPYINYGEGVVAACAAAGTAYVDLTGEPEFVDLMWLRYHEEAERTGARLVHSCGFDSIPYDLGVLYAVERLPEGVPIKAEGFARSNARFSGGTYQSLIHIVSRLRQAASAGRERRRLEGDPPGRTLKYERGTPHQNSTAGGWVVPFPSIDPQNVLRSARALDRYGPDFTYSNYIVAGGLPVAAGIVGGAGTLVALAQLPPARDALLKFGPGSGSGPSPERRARSWFQVRVIGEGGGNRVVTQVSGGDPGYGETSKMLAESALCLAHDDLPARAGQLTPAVAMGNALIDRLQKAGIKFEVLESG